MQNTTAFETGPPPICFSAAIRNTAACIDASTQA
jgi:hypothetical protein